MSLNSKSTGEFYRGKRQKVGFAVVITAIAIAIIVFMVMTFYGLQKYIVVTNEGIKLDIPFINGGASIMSKDDEGNVRIEYEKVDAELVIGEPDYSNVLSSAGEDLSEINAYFVSAGNVNESTINNYVASLEDCKALVLELKPANGNLAWKSKVEFAKAYGLNGSTDLKPIINALKDKDIYVAAQINCLVDSTLASHYSQMVLTTESGTQYSNAAGIWLDPFNSDLRSYIISICRELANMGVDEIILNNLKIPDADINTYAFSASTTTAPTAVSAVSGFALDVTRALKNCGAKISVRCDSETALMVGEDLSTGQNAEVLFKVFDRIYCFTDATKATELSQCATDLIEVGDVGTRFVPVYSGQKPDTPSWVCSD